MLEKSKKDGVAGEMEVSGGVSCVGGMGDDVDGEDRGEGMET